MQVRTTQKFLFLFLVLLSYKSMAACPLANDDTSSPVVSETCSSRVSNPNPAVTITSSGSITANSGDGVLYNNYAPLTITNAGLIENTDSSGSGLFIVGGTNTIRNTGTIRSTATGIDIYNTTSTMTLLNRQGGGDALTFTGVLPSNYNLVVNSTSDYGKIIFTNWAPRSAIVSGATTFEIYAGGVSGIAASTVAKGTYASVLSGLTESNIVATTGRYGRLNWALALQEGSSSVWDLIFSGASASDTQSSMRYQARQLRSAFNTQTVAAHFALNYDCNLFDAKGMCISAGGRYTTIDNPGINHSAAVVTLGYKVNPNIRIGGYLDQNINISEPTGIKISNNTPLMGLYAVWNKEQSGLGYQVRVANTYQDKDVTSTRTVFDTSEAGSGKSSLQSQSYLAELSYAFQYQDKMLVRPYAGLRYTHLKQKGYTEDTTDTVTDPLTVAALRDKGITALLGLKINRSLTDKATLTAQLGLEQDVHHKVGNYSATNSAIGDLDSVAFNSNIKRTRPVASIGAFYDVTKTQRASATINYQQTPFHSTGSTTAYFNYMIGF